MSELKTFDNITQKDIKSQGVQALADRPNASGQYGVGGLSAKQLKEHFDQLAALLAERLNAVQNALKSDDAAQYINAKIPGSSKQNNLKDVLNSITDGTFSNFLKVNASGVDGAEGAESGTYSLKGYLDALSSVLSTVNSIRMMWQDELAGDLEFTIEEAELPGVSGKKYALCMYGTRYYSGDSERELVAYVTMEDLFANLKTAMSQGVTAEMLQTGAVLTRALANGAVTSDKLGNAAVVTEKIADEAVTPQKIKANSISSDQLDTYINNMLNRAYNDSITGVSYLPQTGYLVFAKRSGSTLSVDLPLELIVKDGYFDEADGQEAIVLNLANGDEIRIPLSKFGEAVLDPIRAAETERVASEEIRRENEAERQAAEATRRTNESAREVAESERASAERDRTLEFNGWRETIDRAEQLDTRIYHNERRITQNARAVAKHEARLSALENANGTIRFEIDGETAYAKHPPRGALPYAVVNRLCGAVGKSKNLIPPNYASGAVKTEGGVRWTKLDNGGIRAQGTATAYSGYDIVQNMDISDWVSGDLWIGVHLMYGLEYVGLDVFLKDKNGAPLFNGAIQTTTCFPRSEYASAATISLSFKRMATNKLIFGVAYATMNFGEEPIAYQPPCQQTEGVDVSEIRCTGRNLADPDVLLKSAGWTVSNGIYSGQSATADRQWFGQNICEGLLEPGKRYVFSWDAKCDITDTLKSGVGLCIAYSDGTKTTVITKTSEWEHYSLISDAGKDVFAMSLITSYDAVAYIKNLYVAEYDGNNKYEDYKCVQIPIPDEIRSLEGYGQANPDNPDEYNYLDFESAVFVQKGKMVNGVWVSEAKTVDVSGLIPDGLLNVTVGGAVIMENENKLPVPSEITYQIKNAEA